MTTAMTSPHPMLGGALAPNLTEMVRSGHAVLTGEVLAVHAASRPDGSWLRATIGTSAGVHVPVVAREMPEVRTGVRVQLSGHWDVHPEHGSFFSAIELRSVALPETEEGVIAYLRENLRGCGAARARRLFAVFGNAAIEQIGTAPESLLALFPGRVGRELTHSAATLSQVLSAGESARRITVALLSAGVTPRLAARIVAFFGGGDAAEVVALRDPYRLVDVPGIGWTRADQIARRLGVPADGRARIMAALSESVARALRSGHSCITRDAAVTNTVKRLAAARPEPIADALSECEEVGLALDGDLVYNQHSLVAEWSVADSVSRLCSANWRLSSLENERVGQILDASQLSTEQRGAVRMALQSGCSLITGRPGAGKTTTTAALVRCCEALELSVSIVAPTGKAASRAQAITGAPAQTLHRFLGVAPGIVRDHPVASSIVIVDEASMCSLELVAWLLANVDPLRTRVVFCGDADQLPSVEHGAVLRDLLRSDVLPITQLTKVYRQAEGSTIVGFAHALLDGRELDRHLGGAVQLLPVDSHGDAAMANALGKLVDVIGTASARGVDVRSSMMVLAPVRRGPLGTEALNRHLQSLINPDGELGPEIDGGVRVRVGDRVIQQRNDYALGIDGVFNGEIGIVTEVDRFSETVSVRMETGEMIVASGTQRLSLALAWALTVHRSQGSEYRHVCLMLHESTHAVMLDRAVLYTAATRAKETFTIIGTRHAVERCRHRNDGTQRVTGLAAQLVESTKPRAK